MSVSANSIDRIPDHITDARHLVNCLPVDAYSLNRSPWIKWMDMQDAALEEPFFFQTVERVKRDLNPKEITAGVETLLQLEKITDSIAPSGFVFHTSRCGSTLLANACRRLAGAVVVSEAAAVEKIVSRFFSYSPADHQRILLNSILLRGAISAFGQRRLGNERRLFVKFSALSALQFERIRRIWPNVPCVFMFRNPLEVMVSNLHNPPEWMQFEETPGQAAAVTGVQEAEALEMAREEVCARALGRLYSAGAEISAAGGLLLDYEELSSEALMGVIQFFGLSITSSEEAIIREVAQLYAKDSKYARKFEPDTSRKHQAVTSRISSAVESWALQPYLYLKQLSTTAQTSVAR